MQPGHAVITRCRGCGTRAVNSRSVQRELDERLLEGCVAYAEQIARSYCCLPVHSRTQGTEDSSSKTQTLGVSVDTGCFADRHTDFMQKRTDGLTMRSIRSWLLRGNAIWRHALVMAFVSGALFLSFALESFGNPHWFPFRVAIVAVNWFCGPGPGWLAAALSVALFQYYFIPPTHSFALRRRDLPSPFFLILLQVTANLAASWKRQIEASIKLLIHQMAEQRRTEEALQIARAELARVARITTVGHLAAAIAHEVNQPLAAIVANTDARAAWLDVQTPNLVEARAAAERAGQGAIRASEVVSCIRALITKKPTERDYVQLNEIVEEIVALAAGHASISAVTVVVELAPGLPLVHADRVQLQQVILNLIRNGIEAMSGIEGRPRQLVIKTQTQAAGMVCFSIQDSGIGVSAEHMPRLFEPFFTTRTQGIGMGLSISHSIIEAHARRRWAESTPDHGSVFQFTLPCDAGHTA